MNAIFVAAKVKIPKQRRKIFTSNILRGIGMFVKQ